MSAGESGLNALVAPMVFNEEMDIESLAQTVFDTHAAIVQTAGLDLTETLSEKKIQEILETIQSILVPVFMSIYGQSPQERYSDIFEQVSDLAEHLATRHIFADGNKRTTFKISLGLLSMQNIHLQVEDSPRPEDHLLYQWIQDVVTHARSRAELADFLRDNASVGDGNQDHD